MNKHYTLLTQVDLPHHNDDPAHTKLYVYDIDDDTSNFLSDVNAYANGLDAVQFGLTETEMRDITEAGTVHDAIMLDLDLHDDGNVPAGALFTRYTCEWDFGHTVLVWETTDVNV